MILVFLLGIRIRSSKTEKAVSYTENLDKINISRLIKNTPWQVFSPANHMGFAGENTRKGVERLFLEYQLRNVISGSFGYRTYTKESTGELSRLFTPQSANKFADTVQISFFFISHS